MKLPNGLRSARFISRLNRFAALVSLDGSATLVHLPNSGRLRELLTPGATVYLVARDHVHRKTAYDLCLVSIGKDMVSCDSRIAPFLVVEAQRNGKLEPFIDYTHAKKEVTFGNSRLDLRFSGPAGDLFVEVKSGNLVVQETALFPGAPTSRGTRHLRTLAEAVSQGYKAAVIFVVLREDANVFSPFEEADHVFASTLRESRKNGVKVYAYKCFVDIEEVRITDEIPVIL